MAKNKDASINADSEPSQAALDDQTILRNALVELLASGDQDALVNFCRSHSQRILTHFDAWRLKSASEFSNPEECERFIGGLYAIGKVFANHLGNTGPLSAIIGPSEQSDIAHWERTLTMSMNLIRQMQYEEAAGLLSNQLIDARNLKGHGHLHLSATTHWYLSQCGWLQSERSVAIAHGERSLSITRHIKDDARYVDRYLRHLWSVHRYFGEAKAAASYADQLHDFLEQRGQSDQARLFRRQAEILRKGEPLTRVVAWVGSSRYELDELTADFQGNMKLVLERNRTGFQITDHLIQQGRAHFNEGKFDDAFIAYRQAAAVDRYDPAPLVQLGRAQLFLGQFSDAIDSLECAERLAPGCEFCRTGAWLARHLLSCASADALVLTLVSLATESASDDKKIQKSAKAVADFPDLAVFFLEHGNNLKDAGETTEAEATYRRGLACLGDEDVSTRLVLALAMILPAGAERKSLLEKTVTLGGHPIAAAMAQLSLRFGW